MPNSFVDIDFRPLVNFIKRTEEGARASTTDETVRAYIYQDIVAMLEYLKDSGATEDSIVQLSTGDVVDGKVRVEPAIFESKNKPGTFRLSGGYISGKKSSDGVYIDPVEEYSDRHYGEFSVRNTITDFEMTHEPEIRERVINIIKEHTRL